MIKRAEVDKINSLCPPPQSNFQILKPYLASKESCHPLWNYYCRLRIKSPNPLRRIEFILFYFESETIG